MKRYIAIGHWSDSENIISVAHSNNSLKDFRADLSGNGFIPWMILTEKSFQDILDGADVWEMVKRKVTNYRKWDLVTDYIGQCLDIMEDRINEMEV